MTGPEHYKRAEELLKRPTGGYDFPSDRFAEAQVHATLALAAATALSGELGVSDYDPWREVASHSKPRKEEP